MYTAFDAGAREVESWRAGVESIVVEAMMQKRLGGVVLRRGLDDGLVSGGASFA